MNQKQSDSYNFLCWYMLSLFSPVVSPLSSRDVFTESILYHLLQEQLRIAQVKAVFATVNNSSLFSQSIVILQISDLQK